MEPLGSDSSGTPRLRLSRWKLAMAGAAVGLIAVIVGAVVVLRGGGAIDKSEVGAELKAAIAEFAPAPTATGSAARFDTAGLRTRLEGQLDGWFVDLAADSGATRVGAAARQLDGRTCVFAWSDVGSPRSAVVTDPALPCVAEIALIPAKSP